MPSAWSARPSLSSTGARRTRSWDMTATACRADGARQMVLDTSALLAILFDEPERRRFSEAIAQAGQCAVSAATFVEVSMILESRHGAAGVRAFDRLLSTARVAVAPGRCPAGRSRPRGLSAVRQGPASRGPEFRRLFRLRTRPDAGRAAALQGRGFRDDRPALRRSSRAPGIARRAIRRRRWRAGRAAGPRFSPPEVAVPRPRWYKDRPLPRAPWHPATSTD